MNTRIKKLRAILKSKNIDGYVLADYKDIIYLTGLPFHSAGDAMMLVTQKQNFVFTNAMFALQLKNAVVLSSDFAGDIFKKCASLSLKKAAFDAEKIKYLDAQKLRGFAPAESFLNELRIVKNEEEIKNIRAACKLAFNAYLHLKRVLKTGMSELQAAAELEYYMNKNGASGTSFSTIVAFGEHSANVHHVPTARKLKKQDAVLIDFGCVYKNYCSDISRSWWHGVKAPEEYNKIYATAEIAQSAVFKNARANMTGRQIDAFGRTVIEDAGYKNFFPHGIGHGVGMYIHEAPRLSPAGEIKVTEGMIVTNEPGVYLPGKYGVRLEETCVMAKKGLQILTKK